MADPDPDPNPNPDREIGDKVADTRRPPTLFLHGVPSSSWSFVRVLDDLNKKGWHAYAPDWIGGTSVVWANHIRQGC